MAEPQNPNGPRIRRDEDTHPRLALHSVGTADKVAKGVPLQPGLTVKPDEEVDPHSDALRGLQPQEGAVHADERERAAERGIESVETMGQP